MRIAWEDYSSYLIGIAVSLGLFSAILVAFGYSPILSLETIAAGSFGNTFNASETLVQMAPLLLCALAFLIPFKSRFYNIGVEGQLYVGALFAYLTAAGLGGSLPSVFSIPIVAIASFAGGIAWLAVPLLMRVKLGVNEIFPTIVMNFIAMFLISWLVTGPLKDPTAPNPQTRSIPQSTWLPIFISGTRFQAGVILAVLASLVVFVIMYRTVLGYEIRASGANPTAARAAGISIPKSLIWVGILSGGFAGLAGFVAVDGMNHILVQGFSPGWGYQGIGVAALGAFNPMGTLFASLLYSALQLGGESMQRLSGAASVPIELIYALQVTIVITVLVVQRWASKEGFRLPSSASLQAITGRMRRTKKKSVDASSEVVR